MQSALAMRFLGVGNAHAPELGSSACVLEGAGSPLLLVDCGPDTIGRFVDAYGERCPASVFLTHTHFDHIGGLEGLFYRLMVENDAGLRPRLFVPVGLLPALQRRVADYPNLLAEGGANFWDAFQLIPVSERFWLQDLLFDVFPVRHHEFGTAFGIALKGRFLYTGDTRPIPELLNHYASRGEPIFHDCGLRASPSHTALEDLYREYTAEQRRRLVLYHYSGDADRERFEQEGLIAARPGQVFPLAVDFEWRPGSPNKSGKVARLG